MPGIYRIPMKINGFSCECAERTSDSFERSVVAHRIIGYNGPFLEDGGLNGRRITIDTLWHNDNYFRHEVFLRMYAKKTSGNDTLDHPVYGNTVGKIQSVSVTHNSTEKKAVRITIDFIESGEPQLAIAYPLSAFAAVASHTSAMVNAMKNAAQAALAAKNGLISRMNQVRSMIAGVRGRIAQGLSVFNAAISAITYPSTLAGEMVSAVVGAVDSANGDIEKLIQSPSAAIFGVRQGLLAMNRQLRRQADFGGDILADLTLSYALFNECLLIARTNDEYLANPAGDSASFERTVMLAAGLKSSLANMKKFAMEIIENDRTGTTALAKSVRITSEDVERTLASMNNEREIQTGGETSIYAVLMSQGVPVEYAESVCRRNNIENPNKASGTIFLPII